MTASMKIWNLKGKPLQTKLCRFTIFVLALIISLYGCSPKNKEQLNYSETYEEQSSTAASETDKITAVPADKTPDAAGNPTAEPTGKTNTNILSITAEPTNKPDSRSSAATTEPTNASARVTLLAVGDNLIHSQIIQSGKQKDGSYNYDHLYANLKEDISAADIAVINQETIFAGDEYKHSGYPRFNSPVEIGDAEAAAGFDVILHATNHTMDMGLSAVKFTMNFWKNKPGITVLGINSTREKRSEIPIIEKNGIKIAMLNYTYALNGYEVPENMPYLVNMLDKGQMEKDIKKARELADFVVVFPHWGTEYVYEATKYQKDLVKFFYNLDVDLVIGTHPHVLEPVEWIETEPGHKMLVYYSLGNFISYQKEAPRMLGGMADVTITKDSTGTYISDAGITPIVTHYEIGPSDYNLGIYKLTDYTSVQAMAHGVSKVAMNGAFTYDDTYNLAKQILGSWFE